MATSPQLDAALIAESARGKSAELAEAIGFFFPGPPELTIDDGQPFDSEAWEEKLQIAGLLAQYNFGEQSLLVAIPKITRPDEPGVDAEVPETLDKTLGELLLPADTPAEESRVWESTNLVESLEVVRWQDDGWQIPVEIKVGERTTHAWLMWPAVTESVPKPKPASKPAAEPPNAEPPQAAAPQPAATPKPTPAKSVPQARSEITDYSRSLLRIRVPVMATLASKKQPLKQILELAPGSIIQFEKPCDEMLDLEVGGHPFAAGEAVKVGDKFGIRIMSMILPEERFVRVSGKRDKRQR